jgi:large repetitive protein
MKSVYKSISILLILLFGICKITAQYTPPPPASVRIFNPSIYCFGGHLPFYSQGADSVNLVTNGNFNSGNSGFTSDFSFNATVGCGRYNVANNASAYGWPSCGNHTGGTANMLIVRNNATANQSAWRQSVTVQANTTYKFSIWAARGTVNAVPNLSLSVNGGNITTGKILASGTCNWVQITGFWFSGSNTSANLEIKNSVGSCTNNDYLIDDIYFTRAYSEGTYSWTGPNGFTSNLQNPIVANLTSSNAGTYTVTYTTPSGQTSTASQTITVSTTCTDCNGACQVVPTNPTSCLGNNGSIFVTAYSGNTTFEFTINGTNWFPMETTLNNLGTGDYYVQVRRVDNKQHCRTVKTKLFFLDNSILTNSSTNSANSCTNNNGSITLQGLNSTDEISWISSNVRTFVPASSLSGGNTISNLLPGNYYIQARKIGYPNCYNQREVVLNNTGAPCPSNALCTTPLGPNLFPNGNFGTGTSQVGPPLPSTETEYGYTSITCNAPDDGLYSIVRNTECNGIGNGGQIFSSWDIITEDRTPGDVNGYMMLVNAAFAENIAFEKTITNLCPNTEYQFSAYVRNIYPVAGTIFPNLTFQMNGIGRFNSGPISGAGWIQVGYTFVTENSTSATFSIRNNAPGGNGNDWLIDDIYVGICSPQITMNSGFTFCSSVTGASISATVTDDQRQLRWSKWQSSTNGGTSWSDVTLPVQNNFSGINYTTSFNLESPLTSASNNRQYRVIAATSLLNLFLPNCIGISPTSTITVSQPQITVNINNPTICVGGTSTLISTVAGNGPFQYQWQQGTPWTNIAGATSSQFSPPSNAVGNFGYQVIVRDVNNCTSTSTNQTFSVVSDPVVNINATTGVLCTGGSSTLNASYSGGTGSCTIQWQQSPQSPLNWVDILGANSNSYTTPSLNTATRYRAVVTCTGSGCCN